MKNFFYLFIAIVLVVFNCAPDKRLVSVEWERLYDWESKLFSLEKTGDNGCIIAGLKPRPDFRLDILKLDSNGEKEWGKTYNEKTKFSNMYGIRRTKDGGYVIIGATELANKERGLYIFKLNSNGNKEWSKIYSGARSIIVGMSISQTDDGGYIAGGSKTMLDEDNPFLFYVIKLNSKGEKEWEKTYSDKNSPQMFHSVLQTKEGGYIVSGHKRIGTKDVYIIKLNSKGEKEWEKLYEIKGIQSMGYINDIKQTDDGGYIISNTRCLEIDGKHIIFVIKLNAAGEKEWQRIYGEKGEDNNLLVSFQKTENDNYIFIIKRFEYEYMNKKLLSVKMLNSYEFKLDSKGKEKWLKILDNEYFREAQYIAPVKNDGYIAAIQMDELSKIKIAKLKQKNR